MGRGVEISSDSIINEIAKLEEDILDISETVLKLLYCNSTRVTRLIGLLTPYLYTDDFGQLD
jgi:hypothetical protein